MIAGFWSFRARADVTAVMHVADPEQTLKVWNSDQLMKLRKAARAEKDPATGKMVHWEGPLLTDFIDKSLDGMPLDRKALVDLIILKDSAGGEALIPRSFVNKYPLILALKKDSAPLALAQAVVPWTSQPKSMSEELPIERYFLSNVVRVEFGSYRERFRSVFLSRRTDPSAMKGEKIYVQNCLACHSNAKAQLQLTQAKTLTSREHPSVKGMPRMDDRARRALVQYLDAIQAESSASAPTQAKAQ